LDGREDELLRDLADEGLSTRHGVVVADGGPGLALLREKGIEPTSMGRGLDEIPELFLAAAAAGTHAATLAR
jgi:hypothetical protein